MSYCMANIWIWSQKLFRILFVSWPFSHWVCVCVSIMFSECRFFDGVHPASEWSLISNCSRMTSSNSNETVIIYALSEKHIMQCCLCLKWIWLSAFALDDALDVVCLWWALLYHKHRARIYENCIKFEKFRHIQI